MTKEEFIKDKQLEYKEKYGDFTSDADIIAKWFDEWIEFDSTVNKLNENYLANLVEQKKDMKSLKQLWLSLARDERYGISYANDMIREYVLLFDIKTDSRMLTQHLDQYWVAPVPVDVVVNEPQPIHINWDINEGDEVAIREGGETLEQEANNIVAGEGLNITLDEVHVESQVRDLRAYDGERDADGRPVEAETVNNDYGGNNPFVINEQGFAVPNVTTLTIDPEAKVVYHPETGNPSLILYPNDEGYEDY